MVQFQVPDMTCGGCAASITRALQRVDPAARVDVDLTRKLVRVDSERLDAQGAQATIQDAGFRPVPA